MRRSLLLAVMVFAVLPGCVEPRSDADREREAKYGTKYGALAASENVVKKFLQYPAEADFHMANTAVIEFVDAGKFWRFGGQVDAKNAFGVKSTHSYSGSVFLAENQWHCPVLFLNDGLVRFDQDDFALLKKRGFGGEAPQTQTVAGHPPAAGEDNGNVTDQAGASTPPDSSVLDQALATKQQPASVPAADDRPLLADPTRPFRIWSDATGHFSVEARYAGFKPGFVVLERRDGTTIDVDLTKLAKEDRLLAVRTARERGDLKRASDR